MAATPPPELLLLEARLLPGDMFVLAAPGDVPLREQAAALFEGITRKIGELSGWALEDNVSGHTLGGFVDLMESRAAGDHPWDRVLPHQHEGRGRPLHKLRRPYSMLAALGFPCWVVGRELFTMDLFNPANELMLPYEQTPHRLWQLIPQGVPELKAASVFTGLIGTAAVALNAAIGFGGIGLAQAVLAYRFSEWSRPTRWMKPLPASLQLQDMAYSYMVLRRAELAEGIIDRLRTAPIVTKTTQPFRVGLFHEVGPNHEWVLMGATRPGFAYPQGNDLLGDAIAEMLGRPYAMRRVSKKF